MIAQAGMRALGHPEGWYALDFADKVQFLAYEMSTRSPQNAFLTCDTSAYIICDMAKNILEGMLSNRKGKVVSLESMGPGKTEGQAKFYNALRGL